MTEVTLDGTFAHIANTSHRRPNAENRVTTVAERLVATLPVRHLGSHHLVSESKQQT